MNRESRFLSYAGEILVPFIYFFLLILWNDL